MQDKGAADALESQCRKSTPNHGTEWPEVAMHDDGEDDDIDLRHLHHHDHQHHYLIPYHLRKCACTSTSDSPLAPVVFLRVPWCSYSRYPPNPIVIVC